MSVFWDAEQDDFDNNSLIQKTREIQCKIDKSEIDKYRPTIESFEERIQYSHEINGESDDYIVASSLYASYMLWHESSAEMEGIPVASAKRFHAELINLGFDSLKKQVRGHICYKTIPYNTYHTWLVDKKFILS